MSSMPLAKEGNAKRILLNLNPEKDSGSETIIPKVVFRWAELLRKPLTKMINTKLIKVTPIYKNPKDDSRLESTNYRPINVFKCLQ